MSLYTLFISPRHSHATAWGNIQQVVKDFVTNLRETPQPGEEHRFRLRWRMRLVERALRQLGSSGPGARSEDAVSALAVPHNDDHDSDDDRRADYNGGHIQGGVRRTRIMGSPLQ